MALTTSSLAKAKKATPVSKQAASASTSQVDPVLHRITLLTSQLPPTTSTASSDLNPLAELVTLFASLPLSSPASTTEQQHNRQRVHTALHSAKSVWEALINAGRLHGVLKGNNHKKAKGVEQDTSAVTRVKQWLNDVYSDFLSRVAQVVAEHWDLQVRISALNAMMHLVRSEATFLTSLHRHRQAQFPTSTFAHVVRALLVMQTDDPLAAGVRDEWLKWWNRDDDVRYHFLKGAAALCNESSPSLKSSVPAPPSLVPNLITLLESLITMPTHASELNSWWGSTPIVIKKATSSNGNSSKKRKLSSMAKDDQHDGSTGVFDSSSSASEGEYDAAPSSTKLSSRDAKKLLPPLLSLPAHKRVFQDAYLALLALPTMASDESSQKRVLSMLHRQVLPHMTDPRRLMDWLVDCVGQGGTVAILALNGLFTLMTKYNLEYPDFYTRLYGLLDRDVLHVRYRPRFFRLLVVFMSSSHLPSALVASFIKRLARLALSAPPAAIITIIPFIYNMLKVHPSCMALIHRPPQDIDEDDVEFDDPFRPLDPNPHTTLASASSLWELKTLQQHYLASVSGLAKIFNEAMTKQSYGMEDFLDHSYATLFDTELARKITKAPALAPVPKRQPIGDSLFPLKAKATVEKTPAENGAVQDQGEDGEEEVEPADVVSRMWRF